MRHVFACTAIALALLGMISATACSNNQQPGSTINPLGGFQVPTGKIKGDTGVPVGTESDVVVEDDANAADAPPDDDVAVADDITAAIDGGTLDVKAGDSSGDSESADVKDKPKCQDDDGDGYGPNCDSGNDCDDYNPYFNVSCPDCAKGTFAGCPCKGKSGPCYSADPATPGVGICQAGVQACKDGFWGACVGEIDPGIELCNGKDDDCDGATDENVKSSCGGCDLSCVQKGIGSGSENAIVLNSENSSGVGLDPTGSIVIESGQISLNLKFLWASNSPDSTVSKVDCKTVKEVGRYKVCGDPSRTSVDLDGNVWVACRGAGQVAKIMADKKNCIDKNANGTIETSQDLNGDGNIQANEMVPDDECIKFITPVLGSLARAAGVDKFNNVWIGFWNDKTLVHLKADDGSVMEKVTIPCSPYGLVIDQKGVVWVQGMSCGLVSFDPTSKAINKYNPPFSYGAYGINVDGKGRIWLGGSSGGSGASSYDPKTGQWVACAGVPGSAGIATSNDGFVYTAMDGAGGVGKTDGEQCWANNGGAGSYKGMLKTGGSPHGVAIDFDGFVWGVNLGGNSVGKVDPSNINNAPQVRQVGSGPYTYSDMTGYTLNYFTAPKGLFTTTFFAAGGSNPISATKAKAVWQSIHMVADFKPATKVHMRYRAASTKDSLDAAPWIDAMDFTDMAQLPFDLTKVASAPIMGTMLQIELNLITDDKKVSPGIKSVTAKAKLQ